MLCLFLFFFSFEFSLVSAIPIFNELVPDARATLLAANVATFALGDAVGAYIGPLLYQFQTGLLANALAAVALNLVALVVLLLYVHLT